MSTFTDILLWASLTLLTVTKAIDVVTTIRHVGSHSESNPLAMLGFQRWGFHGGLIMVCLMWTMIVALSFGVAFWSERESYRITAACIGMLVSWAQWDAGRFNRTGRMTWFTRLALRGYAAWERRLRRPITYRGAGILFCIREGQGWKVFLVERRGSGVWSIPGGQMSPADTGVFWLTALRETSEEVGLPCEGHSSKPNDSSLRERIVMSLHYPLVVFRWTTFVIDLEPVECVTSFPNRRARDFHIEFTDARWFRIDELPPKTHWLIHPLIWWLRLRSMPGTLSVRQ